MNNCFFCSCTDILTNKNVMCHTFLSKHNSQNVFISHKNITDVIAIHVYIKHYQKFAMLFLYFIIYFAWHSPPPWCISIVYVVVNQYSYLLNSSKFKIILSRFKKDMSTCNISKLPCKKYIFFKAWHATKSCWHSRKINKLRI